MAGRPTAIRGRARPDTSAAGRPLVLLGLIVALLAAGAVLLRGGRADHPYDAAASVPFPGGVLRVDGTSADHPMSARDMGGMPMPTGPGVKAVPHGKRRVHVAITVAARGPGGLHVTPGRFRLRMPGTAPAAPIDDDTDDVFVPPGAALSRELGFDVPNAARRASLTISGAPRGIALTLVGSAHGTFHHPGH